MQGLMMDFQLTLNTIMRRAEMLYRNQEIVTREPDKSYHRYTYADWIRRTKKLAMALKRLGVKDGERVATLCWNHYQHHELYYAIPAMGGVLHTLNLRLGQEDLQYIIEHAEDKVIVIDDNLLGLYEKCKDKINVKHVIVISRSGDVPEGMLNYEKLIEAEDDCAFEYTDFDENKAMAMCYTSGTTGRPKGVVYSHRSTVLHSMAGGMSSTLAMTDSDTVLPVVPMFHVNAWGIPYTAIMTGSKLVYPGPHMDPKSLLEAYHAEKVTCTAGVPTIWFGMLKVLDEDPKAYDLSNMRSLIVGGAAAPQSMIEGFQKRHNLKVVHAWGMTETSPMGTVSNLKAELTGAPEAEQYTFRAKQGTPVPMIELRIRGEQGLAPNDGKSMGELEIRGPWISSAYYKLEEETDKFTDDGWFKTGDIATLDERGYMEIKDRSKDLVKSGGEWISSVDLENYIMGHEAVAEAAVIAVPHPKWQERPLAVVVLAEGQSTTKDELSEYTAKSFPKWWLPDDFIFVDEIPKTSVGKFKKLVLREQFNEHLMG